MLFFINWYKTPKIVEKICVVCILGFVVNSLNRVFKEFTTKPKMCFYVWSECMYMCLKTSTHIIRVVYIVIVCYVMKLDELTSKCNHNPNASKMFKLLNDPI